MWHQGYGRNLFSSLMCTVSKLAGISRRFRNLFDSDDFNLSRCRPVLNLIQDFSDAMHFQEVPKMCYEDFENACEKDLRKCLVLYF